MRKAIRFTNRRKLKGSFLEIESAESTACEYNPKLERSAAIAARSDLLTIVLSFAKIHFNTASLS
jgi:hypothetical protein